MIIIRPVSMTDLEPLAELAGLAGVGLTTLPKDRDLLARRILQSQASFQRFVERPGGESYLFVMEDAAAGRVVGACGIVSKVGGFQPFYSYHIETSLFESKIINVRKEVPILRLIEDHDGPCEIGSLFLHPDYRHGGNGKMLQLVRFLFIAEHPSSFESTIVSEIRGSLDANGHSPFWDALGQHFFDIDFAEADRLSIVNKKFIAELMPDHPIYVPLLPPEAQAVIGKPHHESERAVKNLEAEGFTFSGMVDIFDAGPVLSCPRDQVRTIRASRRVAVAAVIDREVTGPAFMLGTTKTNFRACKSAVEEKDAGHIRITADTAQALEVHVGDPLRVVELCPPGQTKA
jgi:arginine N-succinyltransferase